MKFIFFCILVLLGLIVNNFGQQFSNLPQTSAFPPAESVIEKPAPKVSIKLSVSELSFEVELEINEELIMKIIKSLLIRLFKQMRLQNLHKSPKTKRYRFVRKSKSKPNGD